MTKRSEDIYNISDQFKKIQERINSYLDKNEEYKVEYHIINSKDKNDLNVTFKATIYVTDELFRKKVKEFSLNVDTVCLEIYEHDYSNGILLGGKFERYIDDKLVAENTFIT